jgi:hypothetical protein
MKPAEHGLDHDGCLRLELLNEANKHNWVLRGQYWTNKQRSRRDPSDRGTVGRITMKWLCRDLVGEHSEIARKHLAEGQAAEADDLKATSSNT